MIERQAQSTDRTLAVDDGPQMPPPYVSRALDAVLMPITGEVRRAWRLDPRACGVMVLSTQPGGIASRYGIRPGDVICRVRGQLIVRPVDLDTAIYFWVNRNVSDFEFDGYRGSAFFHPRASVTLSLFSAAVDLATVGRWSTMPAAPAQSHWTYDSYYSHYRPAIQNTYSRAPQYFEQTVRTPRFSSQVEDASIHQDSFEHYVASRPAPVDPYVSRDNRYTDFDGSSYRMDSANIKQDRNVTNITNNINNNSNNQSLNASNIGNKTDSHDTSEQNDNSTENNDNSVKQSIDSDNTANDSGNTTTEDNRNNISGDNNAIGTSAAAGENSADDSDNSENKDANDAAQGDDNASRGDDADAKTNDSAPQADGDKADSTSSDDNGGGQMEAGSGDGDSSKDDASPNQEGGDQNDSPNAQDGGGDGDSSSPGS